jgi:N-acetyltransferase
MVLFPDELQLENERVLLRPLEPADLEWLLPFAIQEPEIWSYSAVSPASKNGMIDYIETTVAQRSAKKEYPFIVYDKKQGSYAGCTRFYDIQLENQSSQLGYTWYGKRFQRSGLNRNCKWLMLGYAFESWGLERVEFRADSRNERSLRAMKEIGCVKEGVLRSIGPSVMGGRRDSVVLSILKEEWFSHVKEELKNKIYP